MFNPGCASIFFALFGVFAMLLLYSGISPNREAEGSAFGTTYGFRAIADNHYSERDFADFIPSIMPL